MPSMTTRLPPDKRQRRKPLTQAEVPQPNNARRYLCGAFDQDPADFGPADMILTMLAIGGYVVAPIDWVNRPGNDVKSA